MKPGDVHVGDLIRLARLARPWTYGRIFIVSKVEPDIVQCYFPFAEGDAYYRATYDELEAIEVSAEKIDEDLRRTVDLAFKLCREAGRTPPQQLVAAFEQLRKSGNPEPAG
jgi:hypothetical protein